jgi:hypothetical protein
MISTLKRQANYLMPFEKLDIKVDPLPLQKALKRKDYLFGQYPFRAESESSPHREMQDIWIRYRDVTPYLKTRDFSTFADEHDSKWYAAYYELPEVNPVIFEVMAAVQGERLGGVLITKLPPHGQIYPHTDSGWHAAYYEKYYVPIENYKGAIFGFDTGNIEPELGEVYRFDNSYRHWVENVTDHDRIAMIICIRRTV